MRRVTREASGETEPVVVDVDERTCCDDVRPAPGLGPDGARRWALGGTLTSAVLAAIASSACCVGPVLVATLGLGGAGAAAAQAPYRSLLLGATGLLLVGAYLWIRKRERDPACDCETDTRARWLLGVATTLAVVSAASPHLLAAVDARYPAASTATQTHVVIIEVQGMDCASCAVPIRGALREHVAIREMSVDLDAGTVTATLEGPPSSFPEYGPSIAALGFGVGEVRLVR